MTDPAKLANYVQPALSDGRLAAQWSRILAREPQQVSPWRRYALMTAATCSGLSLVFVLGSYWGRSGSSMSPVAIERGLAGDPTITLVPGVVATVAKESKLRLLSHGRLETLLELTRGEATFDVTHQLGRKVIVATPGYDVEVLGTRFIVRVADAEATAAQLRPPAVSVEVLRGTVQVNASSAPARSNASPQSVALVREGKSWSSVSRISDPSPTADTPVTPTAVVAVASATASSETIPIEHIATRGSAKELFEAAERYRVLGRLREAATAFDELRRRFPADPRAPLACFELGRIRMDGLGDNTGAIAAFSAAIRLNRNGAYCEDASARLVQLYDKVGATSACQAARESYLATYRQGSHSSSVRRACER